MQVSLALAKWIENEYSIRAISSYDLFLNDEKDEAIFLTAKSKENVILLSKDYDFVDILNRLQPPPKLIWLKMGNCPNSMMKIILRQTLLRAINELMNNETIVVEINKF